MLYLCNNFRIFKQFLNFFFFSRAGKFIISSSGFLIDRKEGIVISSASILSCFWEDDESEVLNSGTLIEILFENLNWIQAEFKQIINIPSLSKMLNQILGDVNNWILAWNVSDPNEKYFNRANKDWPKIAVFQLDKRVLPFIQEYSPLQMTTIQVKILESSQIITFNLKKKKGQQLFSIGSPFGAISSKTFFNCISTGIANNSLISEEGFHVIMTDMRNFPGMEGSPVFTSNKGKLLGVKFFYHNLF